MHSNSRFLSASPHLFNVRSRDPFTQTRANLRKKTEENRTVRVLIEDETSDGTTAAYSKEDRNPSESIRNLDERRNEEMFPKRGAMWNFLKGIVLILCISCFSYQSTNFCILYFSYPTTLSLALTKPEVIIKPAFTFCSSGGVNRTYFCTEYPHLCIKPSNMTQFCENFPFNCICDVSNLMIPKFEDEDYYNKEILEALRRIILSSRISPNEGNPWSLNVRSHSELTTNPIYLRQAGLYTMCFSSNLHLDDNAEPDSWNFNLSRREPHKFINFFYLHLPRNESFFYMKLPVVLFSVHSPFIQDNPFIMDNELKLGHEYEVKVRLEEEHLLPHPFPTNCTDYDDLWRKNNKTGPRSQEVCQKKCSDFFEEKCWEYASTLKSLRNNKTHTQDFSFCKKLDLEDVPRCKMNCKTNCIKLKYSYTVKDKTEQLESQPIYKRDFIEITAVMENMEVNVMKHNALFSLKCVFSLLRVLSEGGALQLHRWSDGLLAGHIRVDVCRHL
ncbi:uncharacterized protein NPIL_16491 [Nephila pilipes]|uniref:Uncharacterized protein n=1 Tax=Nephila pilipes TaxID=299642 RepID=A0A8X6U3R9_NEPPI|nr:uncharacterized protein NPIL_16491 [Nephila pilipes]